MFHPVGHPYIPKLKKKKKKPPKCETLLDPSIAD
jgi:hypothetical protein